MKEGQISDLVVSLRSGLKEKNAALEAELREALDSEAWIISFAADAWYYDIAGNCSSLGPRGGRMYWGHNDIDTCP